MVIFLTGSSLTDTMPLSARQVVLNLLCFAAPFLETINTMGPCSPVKFSDNIAFAVAAAVRWPYADN